MSWPTNFSSLGGGNEPLSLFDAMFAQVAAMVPIPCTATGTNAITLSPIGNAPSAANLVAYGSLNLFSFIASATSTGAVSAQFGSLASLTVFKNDGTTPVTTGDIAIGRPYMLMFSQALNSGGGGFYLLRPAVQPAGGQPTYQVLTSGTGATYTTPANALQLRPRMIGGGGGGGGNSSDGSASDGGAGGATSFGATSANGGSGGGASRNAGFGVSGGTSGNGGGSAYLRTLGGRGNGGMNAQASGAAIGGQGASGPFGGAGIISQALANGAVANTGAGGSGAGTNLSTNIGTGAGGGAGEYVELVINSPPATIIYTVGAAGAFGASGAGGLPGGAGGSGIIIVEERYQD